MSQLMMVIQLPLNANDGDVCYDPLTGSGYRYCAGRWQEIAKSTAAMTSRAPFVALIDDEIFVSLEEGFEAATTPETPAPARQEEQCPICKRMKDIGKKCWWCGN